MMEIFSATALLTVGTASAAPERLNVVFILADDLGWMDLGCYGSTFYKTPNIDALARHGMRFTQAYAASPLCAPSRSSIMTGLNPARTGMTYPDIGHQIATLKKGLCTQAAPTDRFLLAEPVTCLGTNYYGIGKAFKDAGYATGHFGKWHLGQDPYSPLQHGFDLDIPHSNAPGPLLNGYFYPFHVWKDHGKPGDHLEDLLADEAVKFIGQNKDRPFFLNYWAFEVHSPWQAKPEQIAKYQTMAVSGALQRNPVYAGMVESLDAAVGKLTAALEQAGILDRTVIVFTSDNGPFISSHPAPVMQAGFEKIPVTSVLPLRGGKQSLYEGGLRVPLIVVWPGVTRKEETTDKLALSTDFLPTFIDLMGMQLPQTAFDGVSLRPVLSESGSARDEIFCHFPHLQDTRPYEQMTAPRSFAPAASLRKGDWKLIRFFADGENGADRLELYNLKDDPQEMNNLAAVHPERVTQLGMCLEMRLEENEAVIPRINPEFLNQHTPNVLTEEKQR